MQQVDMLSNILRSDNTKAIHALAVMMEQIDKGLN